MWQEVWHGDMHAVTSKDTAGCMQWPARSAGCVRCNVVNVVFVAWLWLVAKYGHRLCVCD